MKNREFPPEMEGFIYDCYFNAINNMNPDKKWQWKGFILN